FLGVGGFDAERFPRPSIEDIELGYRLRAGGHRIRLDRDLQGTHLKRWRLLSVIRTDVRCRALPWARLILTSGNVLDDLNVKLDQRVSSGLVGLAGVLILLSPLHIGLLGLAAAALAGVLVLNRRLFRFLRRERGFTFALADVGGLARTAYFKGFRFDLGGHRFYTKVAEVDKLWHEVLGDDFIRRPRLSRIYYNGRFFYYPLRPLNALTNLGIVPSVLAILSYLRWRLFPYPREDSFEQWVTNRFGRRLFETFFKTYTEKVWGIPCSTLRAEWAAQRIKDLSLRTAILNMFVKPKRAIKS